MFIYYHCIWYSSQAAQQYPSLLTLGSCCNYRLSAEPCCRPLEVNSKCPCASGCCPGSKRGVSLHLPHFFVSSPCRIRGGNLLHRHFRGKISIGIDCSNSTEELKVKKWVRVLSWHHFSTVCDWWWLHQMRHGSEPKGFYNSLLTLQGRCWNPVALVITHLTLDSSL